MKKAKVIEVLTAEEVENLHSLIESDLPILQRVKSPYLQSLRGPDQ
jgi:hypothetical protein